MKFFSKLSKLIENYFLKIAKFFKIFSAYFALISLILEQFIFVASASAQALPIVPDGSTATQITQTASGIDQVNIEKFHLKKFKLIIEFTLKLFELNFKL